MGSGPDAPGLDSGRQEHQQLERPTPRDSDDAGVRDVDEERRYCRRRHTVLARARFCNQARFSHALGEQALAQAIVDFVRACVQ